MHYTQAGPLSTSIGGSATTDTATFTSNSAGSFNVAHCLMARRATPPTPFHQRGLKGGSEWRPYCGNLTNDARE